MYWRISSFPELQHLSESDRARLIRQRCGLLFYVKLLGFSFAMAVVSLILLFIAFGVVEQVLLGGSLILPDWWYLVFLPTTLFLLVLGWYLYVITRIRGQLRLYLMEHRGKGMDIPMCLNCGYAVAVGQVRCPECGAGT